MMSESYTNLCDLASGNFGALGGGGEQGKEGREGRRMPRVQTVPGRLADQKEDDDQANRGSSGVQSSQAQERIIIVANQLPVRAARGADDRTWNFSWNEDSLLLQLKDGLPDGMEVLYVGSLCVDVEAHEQEEVARALFDRFKCVPAFLPPDLNEQFYHDFCKLNLWPLFHYMLPFSATDNGALGSRFDRTLWRTYVLANKLFFERVVEVISPEDDYVWIHDYHLMALPTFLRSRFNRLRIGFFLHTPFPSSEIYRTLPVREEILKALLNCDLIGFHTFDYARHFLSCCSRMLGIEYQSKRGYIGLDYFGRTVGIKIMPVGVRMAQLQSMLRLPEKEMLLQKLRQQFDGKTLLLGVDDMDIFKGIDLKLLAFEHMLNVYPKLQGQVVLVQIANPARGRGREILKFQEEIEESCNRINNAFGHDGYKPVILIERQVSFLERLTYYTIADCVVVTAVRDGMNLTPYEYIACRQGISASEGAAVDGPRKSMLVLSEFIGCSPSLSGAIRVNPWNIEHTGEAMSEAISFSDAEQQLRHEKHYRYVSTHDVAYWSRSFMHDMERTCKDHFIRNCWGIGVGFGFRVVALDPNFRKLQIEDILPAYARAKSRTILLDYDGTLMSQASLNKNPSQEVIRIINSLCEASKNAVFIVSGRGRENLEMWFKPCEKLGIAAEHGYFIRWTKDEEWKTCSQNTEFSWMQIVEPVMKLYTESTDGSYVETKESALVWHYQDADPDFGSAQAKELLDHLEGVLASEPVSVRSGKCIIEVKLQGVSKGLVAEKILSSMVEGGRQADFLLCIGDDRSDEDMFEDITVIVSKNLVSPNTSIFGCTVGQKPSKARYYLDDTNDVIDMLDALTEVSEASWSSTSSPPPSPGQDQGQQDEASSSMTKFISNHIQ